MKKNKFLLKRLVRGMSRGKIRVREIEMESGTYKGDANSENKPQGNGSMTFKNGERYVGEWDQGLMHGKGEYFYKNGKLKYTGDWKKNFKDGKGTYYFLEGGRYEGDWKCGKKEGNGTTYHANGQKKYKGQWKDNYIWGKGKYFRSSGKLMYDGEFERGKRKGKGTNLYSNNEKYEGDWKDDQKHGDGVYYFNNNEIYKGEWYKDKRVGKGTLKGENFKYVGEFKNDKKCGKGIYYEKKDGEYVIKNEGIWVDGVYAGNNEIKQKDRDLNSPKTLNSEEFDQSKILCVICLENKKDMVFLPCKHLCTCESCANQIKICPLCRAKIEAKIQAFV